MNRNLVLGLLGGTILLTGGIAAGQISKIAADAGMIQPTVFGRIHTIDAENLVISMDIRLTNPTSSKLEFTVPLIQAIFNGVPLGENQIDNRRIVLPPHSTIRLRDELGQDLFFFMPLAQAAIALGTNLPKLLTNQVTEVKVGIKVTTTGFAKVLGIENSKTVSIDSEFIIKP